MLVFINKVEAENFKRNEKYEKKIAKKKSEEIIHERKLIVTADFIFPNNY